MFSLLRAGLTLVVAVGATLAGAAPAAAAPRLALTAIAFEKSTVDVTSAYGSNTLTWTVTNTDPDATTVAGVVTMRMRSSVTGQLIGHDQTVSYEYDGWDADVRPVSGTASESTYRYVLPVRRYSDAETATWEVTRVTIRSGTTETTVGPNRLAAFEGATFTARTRVDSTGPVLDQGQVGLESPRSRYLYLGAGPRELVWGLTIRDDEAGFWKGTLRLAGPGGQSLSQDFTWERTGYNATCGRNHFSGSDGSSGSCSVPIALPSDAATGTWRVASLVLIGNSGARTTIRPPVAPPVTVTTNSTIEAADFTVEPSEVDNWREYARTEVSMTVTGARKGVSSVMLDFGDTANRCVQDGLATTRADGRIAVPVLVYTDVENCTVEGIRVVDGAGNASLYGPAYAAPGPDLRITRVPSTEPPAARAAAMLPDTVKASEMGWESIRLEVEATVERAPVSGLGVFLYDATGETVYESSGYNRQDDDGTVRHYLWDLMPLPPGRYTVGIRLDDEAGNSSFWNVPGNPESRDLPGGPATLTVTEG